MGEDEAARASAGLRLTSARGRWVLLATVLGSGLASLDASVVSIALPAIGRDLGGSLAELQWTVTAYSLSLASLLLLGGALGDRFGRRRVFVAGVIGFTAASVACGLAPSGLSLGAARALQGAFAALLTPGSLAILQASFRQEDRGAAVGAWSGLGGVTTAIAPFAGGYLIQAASWRWIFFLNVPLALLVVLVTLRHVPETRDPRAARRIDVPGATLAVLGLGAITFALIEAPARGPHGAVPIGVAGVLALVALFFVERRGGGMLDLSLFGSPVFRAANLETLIVYAALGGAFFLLPLELQVRLGYSPLAAGAAVLPITLLMLLLSARMGRLAQRIGPRLPMAVGPMVAGAGLALLSRVHADSGYLAVILPAVVVFGLGLAATVAPLTATVLAAAPTDKAGLASAINTCVARTGGLVAVAMLPAIAGMASAEALSPVALDVGFHRGMAIAAAACVVGGLIALRGIPRTP